jgi:D-aminoacyl-tRNA deacylase
MRTVVQRVDRVDVRVNDKSISRIARGLLIFLGIEKGDQRRDADYISEKIINLRIFEDESGKMNLSVRDIKGDILVVSQFTLLCDCKKGRRPSFTGAENSDRARILYDYFIGKVREKIEHVAHGEFQAMMQIELVNNGPVTILLDSRKTSHLPAIS